MYKVTLLNLKTQEIKEYSDCYLASRMKKRVITWDPNNEGKKIPFKIIAWEKQKNPKGFDKDLRLEKIESFVDSLLQSLSPKEEIWEEVLEQNKNDRKEIYERQDN